MKLFSSPTGLTAECKTVEMHHTAVEEAFPGDNVGFQLKGVKKGEFKRGEVFGNAADSPPLPI